MVLAPQMGAIDVTVEEHRYRSTVDCEKPEAWTQELCLPE